MSFIDSGPTALMLERFVCLMYVTYIEPVIPNITFAFRLQWIRQRLIA